METCGIVAQGGSGAGATREENTVFTSVGIAAQDIAVSRLVYHNALAKGLGSSFEPC